jgi:hypothetical protein
MGRLSVAPMATARLRPVSRQEGAARRRLRRASCQAVDVIAALDESRPAKFEASLHQACG